jgi:asparagine synthase (glutamine-hydrolysing)
MCGICGIVNRRGQCVDGRLLEAMRDLMMPRGPDQAGLHIDGHVGLAHRRLAIIDLSPAASQPMTNEDGTIWLVFNGEIYNFGPLREELMRAGHRFRSRSDTEVIIHGYEQWGLEALAPRLRGMFAFAIWDKTRRQLHLCRDHLGVKPLFYAADAGQIAFASDIKCLWLARGKSSPVDPQAIDEFLYFSCIGQQRTIYNDVHKLPPGHHMTFDAAPAGERGQAPISNGEIGARPHRYWQPDYTKKEARTVDQWLEGIDQHMQDAVARRLISDVPLGAFLSGGVDSSAVCAIMARQSSRPIHTFSVGFENHPRWDEREYSRKVASYIGSQHTELVVEPDVAPILSTLVWNMGEPHGDSSFIPQYLISREARKHITVVLTGDGGDEGFAGYSRHLRPDAARRLAWLTPLVTRGLWPLFSRVVSALAPTTQFARNTQLQAQYLAGDRRALINDSTWFDGVRSRLYSPGFANGIGDFNPLAAQQDFLQSLRGPTCVDRALESLLQTTLPNDYLVKVDVATMASSLEARSPFLDVDLLAFAATIPADVMLQGSLVGRPYGRHCRTSRGNRQAKALLKEYAATLVPPEVVYRKKHGFAVPLRQWFKNEWRRPLKTFLLSKPSTDRGYFRPEFIAKILDDHAAGKCNHASRIWTLLVFEIWNRLFIDQTMKPGDPVLEL